MRKRISVLVSCSMLLAFASGPVFSVAGVEMKATVTFLKGLARMSPKGRSTYYPLSLGQAVSEGDTVFTLENTKLELKLETGQIIRLSGSTKFVLNTMRKTSMGGVRSAFKLISGRLWFTLARLTGDSDFQTETPTVVAAVKGTVYRADVAEDGKTELYVYDGVVSASREGKAAVEISAMEKLAALPSAELEKGSFDEADDEKDEWVRWNKNRDKLRVMVIIPEKRGEERAMASVSENAAMKRFMNNYLFKVIEKESVDRIRESAKLKAALKGDNAAAAAAGLEVAADVIVVGEAKATYFKSPVMGGLISASANLTARAVRADTAEVLAAYSPERASRAVDITDEAAAHKALSAAGEKAASEFVDSIVTRWKTELRKGAGLDLTVDGVDYKALKSISNVLSEIAGVKDVQQLYLVGRRALLNLTYQGDSNTLAEEIGKAEFPGLKVFIVGLSAYRLELEVNSGSAEKKAEPESGKPAEPAKSEESGE